MWQKPAAFKKIWWNLMQCVSWSIFKIDPLPSHLTSPHLTSPILFVSGPVAHKVAVDSFQLPLFLATRFSNPTHSFPSPLPSSISLIDVTNPTECFCWRGEGGSSVLTSPIFTASWSSKTNVAPSPLVRPLTD